MTISLILCFILSMLMYLGQGQRFYGDAPLGIISRPNWEFQAVVKGQIAPVLKAGTEDLSAQRLWIFPPQVPHGWTGKSGHAARVTVFHYPTIPACLAEAIPEEGYLSLPLKPAQCRRMEYLAKRASAYFQKPGPLTPINAEHTLLELSLMALEYYPLPPPEDTALKQHKKVEEALAWFKEHLDENPGLSDLARAVHSSTAQLRRLFHRTLGCSPQTAMNRIQFQKATDLMSDPSLTLEAIAYSCGFGSASAFSRAFKHHFGYPPLTWRKSLLKSAITHHKINSN